MSHVAACQTYKIEEVARLFGIGRNAAYEAARRGEIPVIRLGKRLVAPKAAIDKMLGIHPKTTEAGSLPKP